MDLKYGPMAAAIFVAVSMVVVCAGYSHLGDENDPASSVGDISGYGNDSTLEVGSYIQYEQVDARAGMHMNVVYYLREFAADDMMVGDYYKERTYLTQLTLLGLPGIIGFDIAHGSVPAGVEFVKDGVHCKILGTHSTQQAYWNYTYVTDLDFLLASEDLSDPSNSIVKASGSFVRSGERPLFKDGSSFSGISTNGVNEFCATESYTEELVDKCSYSEIIGQVQHIFGNFPVTLSEIKGTPGVQIFDTGKVVKIEKADCRKFTISDGSTIDATFYVYNGNIVRFDGTWYGTEYNFNVFMPSS